MSPDVIIIGAGSAGCVVARRLLDQGLGILLLEAGGQDTNPAIHDISRMGELWHGPEDWAHHTVPQSSAAQRRLHLPRGKVLGGSHALNAMIYVRGAPSDFDHWAAAGNDGWGWDDVLPLFKEIENYDGGPSALRGIGGPLDVVGDYPLTAIQESMVSAAQEIGLPHNPDYNGETLDGISQQQITVRDGERLSTYRAYLGPVLDAPRLRARTGAAVHRVLIESGLVRGVEYVRDGSLHREYADQVILCAGALASPRILLASGIGAAAELDAVGIPPVLDLPGVGRNLHDHLLSPVIFTTRARQVPAPVTGTSVTQTHLFARSTGGLDAPDTQPINFSVPMYDTSWMTGPATGFSLMAGLVRPHSRGSVRLSGPDPDDELLIDLAALREEADLDALEFSVRQCREIGAASALAQEWGALELYPGPDVRRADELRDYVRRTAITYHHQVGTCAMGVDENAVVDPWLRVHGIEGLRVADASVMPRITSGNTNAPAILIGERAAGFLAGS